MKKKKLIRYYADCGKGYWKKQICLDHEIVCKCWTNPKNKACKTCAFGIIDFNDDEGHNMYWDCTNKDFTEHSGAPGSIIYISVGCKLWKNKK